MIGSGAANRFIRVGRRYLSCTPDIYKPATVRFLVYEDQRDFLLSMKVLLIAVASIWCAIEGFSVHKSIAWIYCGPKIIMVSSYSNPLIMISSRPPGSRIVAMSMYLRIQGGISFVLLFSRYINEFFGSKIVYVKIAVRHFVSATWSISREFLSTLILWEKQTLIHFEVDES